MPLILLLLFKLDVTRFIKQLDYTRLETFRSIEGYRTLNAIPSKHLIRNSCGVIIQFCFGSRELTEKDKLYHNQTRSLVLPHDRKSLTIRFEDNSYLR